MDVSSDMLIRLIKRCDELLEFALYIEKVSNDIGRSAKSIKDILQSTEKQLDLPLDVL